MHLAHNREAIVRPISIEPRVRICFIGQSTESRPCDLVLPDSGKTMMARRLPSILPPLSPEEALETTNLYSLTGWFVN